MLLLGPPGVGFLYIFEEAAIDTLYEGGSGFHSLSFQQTQRMPHKFEAGTLNYLGLACFRESLYYFIQNKEEIVARETMG